MAISEIGQIAITVSNVEKAVEFYNKFLGLEFLFSPSPNLAFLQTGSIRIMLTIPQGAGTVGANSILYFKVSEIENTYKELTGKGVKGEHEPQFTAKMFDHDLWIGFIRDPDNNLIGLMEEKR